MKCLKNNIPIEEKLIDQHKNFLKYCQESGKKFVEELDREDFIAYRAEYSVPREQIEQLKNLLGFQENGTLEEVLTTPNSANDTNQSLRKYFKIPDFKCYENVVIADLDFNTRVQRCLKSKGYSTLDELLNASWEELSSIRNFGQGCFENICKMLEKYFKSHRKNCLEKARNVVNKELDEDLLRAATNNAPQISSLIMALEKFVMSIKTKNFFQALPNYVKDMAVYPCLRVHNFEGMNFFPENLTFAELPTYLSENSLKLEIERLHKVVQELIDFDVRAGAKKIINATLKNNRGLDVVCRRVAGETLEQIGKDFGLTRERVRQIESKATNIFSKQSIDLVKILRFIYVMLNGKPFITLDDAKNFIDEDDAQIIWYLVTKNDLTIAGIRFDSALNAFIFNEEKNFDENEIVANLPQIMDAETFNATLNKLAREKNISAELIKFKIANFYNHSEKFFYRKRITIINKFEYVLKERFANGYKIADEMSYSRFIRYLQEIFDEKTTFTQRNVDSKVGLLGVLCGRGKYIHPDFVHVPKEIINRVKDFIDSSERTAILYKEIFETLRRCIHKRLSKVWK